MPVITTGYNIAIKLVGSFIGQETINVFHFNSTLFVNDVTTTLTDWWSTMQAPISNSCNGAATWTSAELQEIGGGGVFGSIALADSGNVSGDSLPPFVAWDFTFVRQGALERNGYKRIAGVPESTQSGGVVDNTFRATLDVLATAMATGFGSGGDFWQPTVQRKYINHIHQTTPKFYGISNVVYSKIGSQNSRKFGHGR